MLVPTNLGIVLIHGLHAIDPQLSLPTLRSDMEKKIAFIAEGKAHFEDVLKDEISIFRKKFVEFVSKVQHCQRFL
jgi:DNA topoisomerase-3